MNWLYIRMACLGALAAASVACGSEVVFSGRGGSSTEASGAASSGAGGEGGAVVGGVLELETSAILDEMTVAPDGAVYLALRYEGTGFFVDASLPSHGQQDIAIVKLDATGGVEWVRTLGGPDSESARGLAMTPDGDLIVCGDAFGPLDLGGGTLSPEYFSAFVARYTPSGDHVWSRLLEESEFSESGGCAVEPAGRVFTALNGEPAPPLPTLAAYSPDGELLWVHYGDGPGFYASSGVAIDAAGNPTVGSTFAGTVDFGAGELTSTTPELDVAVVSYTDSGDVRWVTQIGEADAEVAVALARTGEGLAVAGSYGVVYIPNDPNYAVSAGDAFVARLGPDGEVRWKWLLGSKGIAEASSVVESAAHGVWVGGLETMPSGDQGFLVELDENGQQRWTIPVSPMTAVSALARKDAGVILAAGDDAVGGGDAGPVVHAIYLLTVVEKSP